MKLHSDTYGNYKNSEGEWAGQVPAEWQEKRVKDLFRMVTHTAPANNDCELLSLYASIGVRPRKDMEARGNKASSTDGYWIVKKGDIIVNKLLAWMGSVGLSEYDGVTSPAYDILRRIKPDLDPRYYSYLFRSETAKKIFRKNSRGIMDMRLRLYFDKLGAITVPVPPPKDQKDIADYIDIRSLHIDNKIDLLEKKSALLIKLKKAVINKAVTFGLDKIMPMIDSDEAWIGQIPKHWGIKRIKEVATVVNGATPKSGTAEYWNGDLPWVTTDDLGKIETKYIKESKRKLTSAGYSSCGSTICPAGSVVISGRAPIGNLGILDIDAGTNQGCKTLVTNKKQCSNLFLYYSLLNARSKLEALGRGTTFIELSTKELGLFKIALPSLSEQKVIAEQLEQKTQLIESEIALIDSAIGKYQELRIAIINDAVTGKIKVVGKNNYKGQAT